MPFSRCCFITPLKNKTCYVWTGTFPKAFPKIIVLLAWKTFTLHSLVKKKSSKTKWQHEYKKSKCRQQHRLVIMFLTLLIQNDDIDSNDDLEPIPNKTNTGKFTNVIRSSSVLRQLMASDRSAIATIFATFESSFTLALLCPAVHLSKLICSMTKAHRCLGGRPTIIIRKKLTSTT